MEKNTSNTPGENQPQNEQQWSNAWTVDPAAYRPMNGGTPYNPDGELEKPWRKTAAYRAAHPEMFRDRTPASDSSSEPAPAGGSSFNPASNPVPGQNGAAFGGSQTDLPAQPVPGVPAFDGIPAPGTVPPQGNVLPQGGCPGQGYAPLQPYPWDLRSIRKEFSRVGLGVALLYVAAILVQLIVVAAVTNFAPGLMDNEWVFWLVMQGPLYLVGVPLGIALIPKGKQATYSREPMTFGRFVSIMMISWVAMYAGNLAGSIINSMVTGVTGAVVENPVADLIEATSFWPRFLVVVVIGPIMEELVFRKAIIDGIRVYGEKTAVLLSAALFGLFHGNLSQMFYAFSLGLVFGYVYLRTGKLRWTIGLHMFINFMGSVVAVWVLSAAESMSGLNLEGDLSLETMAELLPSLLTILVYALAVIGMLVAGVVLLIVNRKKLHFDPAPRMLPEGVRFKTICLNVGMILMLLVYLSVTIANLFA